MYPVQTSIEMYQPIVNGLNHLSNTRQRTARLSEHFSLIGMGSGRRVFALDKNWVLKLAQNKKGLAQNLTEWDICQDGQHHDYLARVIAAHPDGQWIIQERVTPLDLDQFENWLGHDVGSFFYCLRFGSSTWKNPFFLKLTRFIRAFNLEPFDISDESSWGMRQGVPVICDFGLNKTIAKKYYNVLY